MESRFDKYIIQPIIAGGKNNFVHSIVLEGNEINGFSLLSLKSKHNRYEKSGLRAFLVIAFHLRTNLNTPSGDG